MVIWNKLNCWYVVGKSSTDHAIDLTDHIPTTVKLLPTTYRPHMVFFYVSRVKNWKHSFAREFARVVVEVKLTLPTTLPTTYRPSLPTTYWQFNLFHITVYYYDIAIQFGLCSSTQTTARSAEISIPSSTKTTAVQLYHIRGGKINEKWSEVKWRSAEQRFWNCNKNFLADAKFYTLERGPNALLHWISSHAMASWVPDL